MQYLIQIQKKVIDGEQLEVVSARDLWEFLGSKRQFGNWVAYKVGQSQAVEGEDFGIFNNIVKYSGPGKPRVEYWITVHMASHWALMEGASRGKQFRDYVLQMEKVAKQLLVEKLDNSALLLEQIKVCNSYADWLLRAGAESSALIAKAHAAELAGTTCARALLPKMERLLYTPTQLGDLLSKTPCMIGRTLKKLGLHGSQNREHSEPFKDKSKYSRKEVISYRYDEFVYNRLHEWFNGG